MDRFANADRRFDLLAQKYANFVNALSFFEERRCPVRGISVTKTDDPLSVRVRYRTVTICLQMLYEMSDSGSVSGRVVCIIEKPLFSTERRLIDSVSFNTQGLIEVNEGEPPLELEHMAPEIVLGFLNLGLNQQVA